MLRTGSFTLSANSSNLKTIMDCTEGRVVEVSFTATQAPVEFFVVHSDDWDLSGTPDISACEFYITARSATHQFVLDRGGTWYLYFKNGPTSQEVTWTWTEYTQQSWAIRQFTTWTMISAVVVGAVLIMFWYWRSRR
jgi:hypothetical protein